MGGSETRVTRVARAVWAATSRIFRCPGLQRVPPHADDLGAHDLAYWLIFLAVLAGWFLFVFAPQRERLSALDERCTVLMSHVQAEQRELARLQRSIHALQGGDPRAWEGAARGRLGWVEPGEITDLARGMTARPAATDPARNSDALLKPPPVLPRPLIPPLPAPAPTLRPQDLVAADPEHHELLGPARGAPPPPPRPAPALLRLSKPPPVTAAPDVPATSGLRLARQ